MSLIGSSEMHCNACGAEFDESEIEWDWDGGGDDVGGECPVCGSDEIEGA